MRKVVKVLAFLYVVQALLGLTFGVYVGIFHGDKADAYIRGFIIQIEESIRASH